MNEHEVQDKIFELIKFQLRLSQDEHLDNKIELNTLGADSLDACEVLMLIEEEFEIEIPDDDCEDAGTIGDIINIVVNLVEMEGG